ncbi:MAG TPA: FAD-dependent oxidoreductase, partial [Candidatus Hydrogenedentes bacterium]|nr:FAD-dependent oxidoreductase [Candidatus Hydrogenedentota bacterium]
MCATPHQALRSSSTALVIGGGLGGLSAAIHLRLAGAHVLLLEANERVGGRAGLLRFDGYRFDTGPSLLNYPWVFEDLFRAAGKRMRDYVDLIPVDPSIRFQWPDGASFTLSARLDLLIEECSRLEPGSAPAVMAFLRDTRLKYDLAFAKLVSRNADSLWEWARPLTLRECARISVWRSLHA